MISAFQICLIFSFTLFTYTHAHGALIFPPSRNSRAQFNEYLGTDWQSGSAGTTRFFRGPWTHSDVTSVCGAPAWDTPGEVGATFTSGQIIEVEMVITAPHAGYHEFRLCPYAPSTKNDLVSCLLPASRLRRVNPLPAGSTVVYPGPVPQWTEEDLATRWRSPSLNGASPLDQDSQDGVFTGRFFKSIWRIYKLAYYLPAGVTCDRCIFQWFYQSTNSAATGHNALGEVQGERFWNCADIKIVAGSTGVTTPVTTSVVTPPSGTTGGATRCGAGYSNAASKCGTTCTTDAQCPTGETCFALLSLDPCVSTTRCGAGYNDAATKCGTTCTTDAQCPSGETCFALLPDTPCTSFPAVSDEDTFATSEPYPLADSDADDDSDHSGDDSDDDSDDSADAQSDYDLAVSESPSASATSSQGLGGGYIALIVIGALCIVMTIMVVITLFILHSKISSL